MAAVSRSVSGMAGSSKSQNATVLGHVRDPPVGAPRSAASEPRGFVRSLGSGRYLSDAGASLFAENSVIATKWVWNLEETSDVAA